MNRFCQKISIIIIFVIAVFCFNPNIALGEINPMEIGRVVQEIETLDATRSGLAVSLEGSTEEPTLETFKQVCKPVGMKAKQLSQENGWQIQQIAQKYRNPDHAPHNLRDKIALAKLEQNPDLMGFWEKEAKGIHYYRRIDVEASCLACHGRKNSRPQFVQDKYPQDMAFEFQVGDLRGMYSVLIPEELKNQLPE
jgi:hypothetical protein